MNQENPTADHAADGSGEYVIEKNLKSRSTWLRLVFMMVFCALLGVAAMVATAVVALGFLWVLFTGEPNPQLKSTGASLAAYLSQVVRYLTFNSNEKPFPFDAEWPLADVDKRDPAI